LFVVFNIAGTFGTVFVARWFGDAFGEGIAKVVRFFEANLVTVTLVSFLLVIAFNWYSRRRTPADAEKGDGAVEP
jgi:membrane protein DedA with SNARE-associated domain